MTFPTPRRVTLAVLAAAAVTVATLMARADDPATRPAAAPPARDVAAVQADLQADDTAFHEAVTSPEMLTDPAARKRAAPTAVPAIRKVYADLDALAAADPAAKPRAAASQAELDTLLAVFGEADAAARLAAAACDKDSALATTARGEQLMVRWVQSGRDAAVQAKVADDAESLAKAHPDSQPLTQVLFTMSQVGPANKDLAGRVQRLVTDVMRNPLATQMAAAQAEQTAGDAKQKALEGKPMTIVGKTVEGKDFTTADWKGKVILVDHWATWCPPCREELPRVQKLYADYHARGLEVLGVSNDNSAEALTKFVAGTDGKMPWPQLFDPAAAAARKWNPITTGFGIDGIPTMYLIDRHGVCRTVEAREQMEQLIPQMLDEK